MQIVNKDNHMHGKIAVVDYGMGNAQSVLNAVESLGEEAIHTNKKSELGKATHIILPGVGAFPTAMANLKKLGLVEFLTEEVVDRKKPFLGLCLGMQLVARKGHEVEDTDGLGWIDAEVKRFQVENQGLKVPHVGWNDVECDTGAKLFKGVKRKTQTFYFVHSYYMECADKKEVCGWCDYGIRFAAAMEKENIMATQFHPEKSQQDGLDLIRRFVDYNGEVGTDGS